MQRVIDMTRKLKTFFPATPRPPIVTNVGGYTADAALTADAARERALLLAESLADLDADGVEIIAQTMPPYPWHFGGQRYHNLFVSADDILSNCEEMGLRVCLDVSHSKLACNHHDRSFRDFIRLVGPVTAHLHIADARGVDGEGLQIGHGDIDFAALAEDLGQACPGASFIPEIWQGHKNGGEGFWQSLHILDGFGL
jgi:N-acetylneuraminate synthase